MTADQARRVLQAIAECDKFIEKEESRDPALRPAEIAQHLAFCKSHKLALLAMVAALEAVQHPPMRVGDVTNIRVEGHPEPVPMHSIHLEQSMNAGGGIALVVMRGRESDGLARLMSAAPELLAYALCEDARGRGEDIAETVLMQHGFERGASSAQEFMDRMRRAAIAKSTGAAA